MQISAPTFATNSCHQLILLDGTAFLFRAYFSTLAQNLSNDEGFPTGAMFGVINARSRLLRVFLKSF
jgi:DNA polymerase-1